MVINCRKCGAGNKQGAQNCRMCGEVLDQSAMAPQGRPPRRDSNHDTVVFPDLKTQVVPAVATQPLRCPHCSASNEPGWAFCQHCGKKLGGAAVEPPAPQRTEQKQHPAPPLTAGPNDQFYAGHGVPGAVVPFDPNQETVVLPALPQQTAPTDDLQVERPREEPPRIEPARKETEPELQGQKCPACRHMNLKGSVFCANCGAPQAVVEAEKPVPKPAPPAPPPAPAVAGRLRLIIEGSDDNTVYELKDETLIGRRHGDITFTHDGYMSDSHARIVRRGNDYVLSDEGSRNGVYVKIKPQAKLEPGDYILIGRQLFQFKV